VLHGLSWSAYKLITEELLQGRHLHWSYDQGRLELVTTSLAHGAFSRVLCLLVLALGAEFRIRLFPCGDITCDREDLDRGLQPDECFYITHAAQMAGRARLDLSSDPPPDLAIEVDVSRDSRSRLPIYAGLRVPEVWRFDGTVLTFLHLGPEGEYTPAENSRYFAGINAADLLPFVLQAPPPDANALVEDFRAAVRQRLGKSPGSGGNS
jgi:Uma2 family endonuclease